MTLQSEPTVSGASDRLAGTLSRADQPIPPHSADSTSSIWRDLGRNAGAGSGQPAVLAAILKAAVQLFPDAASGVLYLYHLERLFWHASQDLAGQADGAAANPAALALAAAAAQSGAPLFEPDLALTPAPVPGSLPTVVALLALPLKSAGRVVGVLNLGFAHGRVMTAEDFALGERLNEQAAIAIDSAWLFENTRRQVQELTVLHLVAVAAAESANEDELIGRATQLIGAELFPDNFGVMLLDARAGVLRMHPTYQGLDADTLTMVVPLATGLTGAVAAGGRAIRVGDVRADARFVDLGPVTLSEICVPLKAGELFIGVANAESARPNAFSEDDERLLTTLANQLAIAIDRLRVQAAERRASERASESRAVLYEASQAINASLDPEQVYTATHRAVTRLMACDAFTITVLSDDEQYIELVYAVDNGRRLGAERADRRAGLTGRVLSSARPIRVDQLAELGDLLPLHFGDRQPVQSLVAVPMRLRGKVFGMLSAQSYAAAAYAAADEQILNLMANQAAVAIEHARLFVAEREQRELEAVLRETGAILSASLETDAVLDRLLEQLERVVPFVTGTIFLVNGRHCRMARLRGYEQFGPEVIREISGMTLDLDSTPTLRTLVETGAPFIIPDTARYPGWLNFAASAHIRSWIGAPMVAQGEVVALFALDQITPDFFHARHAQYLATFAGQAALAIKNSLLFEAQRQRVSALTALHEVSLDLSQQLDPPGLLGAITQHAVRLVQGNAGGLYLLLPDGWLESAVSHQYRGDYAGLRLAPGEGIGGQVVASGQTIIIGDYPRWPSRALAFAAEDIRSAIGTPVRANGQIVGVLVVTHQLPNRFGPNDAEIVTLFGDQAAVAIMNARLYAETRATARELSQLFAASQEMGASRAPQAVLEALARHLTEGLVATSAYIIEVDLESASIAILAEYWGAAARASERVTARASFPLVDFPHAERSARQQTAVQFRQSDADVSPAERVFFSIYGIQAELIVPVLARGQTLGLAAIWDSGAPRVFTSAEIRLAQTLARQAASVIDNARLFAAREDETRRLELLYGLSQSLTASLNLGEVAGRALELVRAAFSADEGAIFVPAEIGEHLVLAAVVRTSGQAQGPAAAGLEAVATRAADLREIVTIQRAGTTEHHGREILVAVPLIIGDSLVGVCALASREASSAMSAALPMLSAAAAPMALALQNAQLFDAEARRAHHLEALNEISRAAVGALDFSSLLQTMAARLGDLLAADACYLTLWDETRRLPLPAASSRPTAEISPLVLPPGGVVSVTEVALRAERAVVADDIQQAPYLIDPSLAEGLLARSVIALPLITGSRRLGAAIVEFHQPHHFTAQEIDRGEQAARQIALAIARAELFEETRRRADEVTAASEVLRALNARPDVVEAFPAILRGLRAISRCDRVRISILDPTDGLFSVVVDDAAPSLTQPSALPYRLDDLAAAADVMAGREHLASDLAAELDYPVEAGLFADGLRSSVTLPLRATERVVGALRLCWRQAAGYRTVNIASLAQIADAIALALEKNRLYAETRRRADELSTLVNVSTALRAAPTSKDMLPIFLQQACQVTGALVSTIFMLDGEANALVMRGSYPPDSALIGLRQGIHEGIAGYVAQTGTNYISRDLQSDPLVLLSAPVEADYLRPVRSSLTVPLRTHEGVVGVLHVGLDRPHDFSPDEVHLLTAIAEIAGSALQRANLLETLEQRVAERTRMLAEANERLKELDRLKDQFISNVSHELRTPLTNIKLHLSLLERRGTDALGRYLPTIQRETERLRRLIDDLLDLSRLQAQIAAPHRQPQRLDHLLGEIMALYATRAEARGLSLTQASSPQLSAVPVDRAQMLQVFTNLIGNAIAYTPEGGGVQVDSQPEADEGRPGVSIYFKNWPAVIPPSDLPHLFDRFFRGTLALESGEAGTGLGLAISKEIVELHAGRIWVNSGPDAVITVGIWLPLTQ